MRSGLLGVVSGISSDTAGGISLQGADRAQRVRDNDEEIQREESSSTESTHQEVKYRCLSVSANVEKKDMFDLEFDILKVNQYICN